MGGPLQGVRVVEIASAAPAPFACMLLGDLGAEVLRVGRASRRRPDERRRVDPLARGRRTVEVDLKSAQGVQVVRRLAAQADVLVEGFRPGVAERLGIGPQDCHAVNPRLIYGRMTGWGQTGPLADRAGHDINYISVAGALEPIGRKGRRPVPPLNLVGDFGGGGMLLAFGIVAALYERDRSGTGQVVDAAMVDGAALLTAFLHGVMASGEWSAERGTNLLDGGAPFYDTYETADGRHVSVGALERRFYAQLLDGLGLDPADLPPQYDRSRWPELRARLAEAFRSRTRDEWEKAFAGTDACVTPVLTPEEATRHPHAVARQGFVEVDGVLQPAPAPRFPARPPRPRRPALTTAPRRRCAPGAFRPARSPV
ncbi:CoA transferase [Actinomadura sp. NBRC 104425]|uniref:CaiB/BaiF CoA transferase family protein n=1 Tax=Actinomadura sp. NBRC 104425 TaxID=3032204 RepID=UPI0024A12178|nr:CaiB/BaiF CoA-transferase family protein [Actinomadura sp. NBRC 104425]GLZ15953.1 CoA transferase [Actinomadura sp. NBRC 104425]